MQLFHGFLAESLQKLETWLSLENLHEVARLDGRVALPLVQVLCHYIALFFLLHLNYKMTRF